MGSVVKRTKYARGLGFSQRCVKECDIVSLGEFFRRFEVRSMTFRPKAQRHIPEDLNPQTKVSK